MVGIHLSHTWVYHGGYTPVPPGYTSVFGRIRENGARSYFRLWKVMRENGARLNLRLWENAGVRAFPSVRWVRVNVVNSVRF